MEEWVMEEWGCEKEEDSLVGCGCLGRGVLRGLWNDSP